MALAQVPEAVAFSFTAGVDPIIGLQAAWMMCFITAILGGAPGMISGATGAIAVVLPAFVAEHGLGFLFVAIILMGIIQMIFGLLGAGKLVKLIGAPTMLGFVNGLAIVIFLAQFHTFKEECSSHEESSDSHALRKIDYNQSNARRVLSADGPFQGCWLDYQTILWQCLLIICTMLTIYLLPKLTKAFPASLAGIILATALEFALIRPLNFETPLVEDLASVKGAFPIPVWLDSQYSSVDFPSFFDIKTYKICLPVSLTLAVIGLVESLLTLQLVSEVTRKKGEPKRECLAQGVANVITGILGGMGGCAMIGQSMINVTSGGITRISSAVAGLFLLIILLAAYPLINLIPIAGLTGVMFMVVIGTFDWNSLKLIFSSAMPLKLRSHPKLHSHSKVKRTDVVIIIVVTVVAVLVNLAVAVAAGVLISTVVFTWDQKDVFYVYPVDNDQNENDSKKKQSSTKLKVYKMYGPLFFGTSQTFEASFNPKQEGKDVGIVELDVSSGSLCDYSAIVSINKVAQQHKACGKIFKLRNVNQKCMEQLRKAKHLVFTYDRELGTEENDSLLRAMEIDSLEDIRTYYSASNIRVHNDGEFQVGGSPRQGTQQRTKDDSNTIESSSTSSDTTSNRNAANLA